MIILQDSYGQAWGTGQTIADALADAVENGMSNDGETFPQSWYIDEIQQKRMEFAAYSEDD